MKKQFSIKINAQRWLLVVVAICCFAFDGSAQYLGSLSDSWSQAPTAAYSTRKVISTYSGAAMKLRRSNDNAEIDVFFDANGWVSLSSNVGTATSGNLLLDWVGANSAFVTRWYDQSGNANHATPVECSGTLTCTTSSTSVTGSGAAFNVELAVGTKIYDAADGAYITTVGSALAATSFTASGNPTKALTAGKIFTRESQPRFISGGVIDVMPNGRPALYLTETTTVSGVITSGLTTPLVLSADANVNVFAVAKRTQVNPSNTVAIVLGNWTNFNTASAGNFSVGYWDRAGLATRSTITTNLATVLNQPYATQFYVNAKKTVAADENTGIVQLDAAGVTTSSAVVAGATAFTNASKLNLFRPVNFAPRALMGYCPEVIYYASTTADAVYSATDATALQAAQKVNFMDAVAAAPATIVQVGASKTYTTIQAAYNALPALISSPYIIELQSDYVSSTESLPITLAYVRGASVVNSITIRPATGVSASFSASSATPLFKLDGSKYVIIDGRSGGVGSAKNISIENKSTDAAASTILMANAATGNKIQYCTVLGSAVSTTSTPTTGTIAIGSTTETVAGCNNNAVENCDVANSTEGLPTVGIYLVGTTGFTTEGTVVSNNNISNYFNPGAYVSSGIYVGALAQSSIISANKLFQTATRTYTAAGLHYPISVGATATSISDNTIGYSSSTGTGTMTIDGEFAHRFAGIKLSGTLTTMKGNVISDIDVSSTSTGDGNIGVVCGIFNEGNVFPAGDVNAPNIVRNITLNASTSPTSTFSMAGISTTSWTGGSIMYNVVDNLKVNFVGANAATIKGILYGIYAIQSWGVNAKQNRISNLKVGIEGNSAAHIITAISATPQANQGVTCDRNIIYNLNAVTSGAAIVTGIFANAGTGASTIKNNIVNLGNDMASPAEIRGIYKSSTGADKFYHNTIFIGGTTFGTTENTYCYYRNAATPAAAGEAIQNNIFVNKRIGGASGSHYAVKMLNAEDYSGGFIACNNNLLQVATDASAKLAFIGADVADFGTLTNSFPNFATGSKNEDPMFVAPTVATPDMHISSANSPANQSGVAVPSITEDYYGMLRADFTGVDMGAVVIAWSVGVETVKSSNLNLNIYAVNNSIIFDNLAGRTASVYSLNGQLVKSVLLSSDKVSVPSAKGFYIVKVGTDNTKVLVK